MESIINKRHNLCRNRARRFTKRLCQKNNLKFNSYADRLKLLGMETLEKRRFKRDIILMFKMFKRIIDLDFDEFFTPSISSANYNLRGHSHRLKIPKHSGSTLRDNFFSNRILSVWNNKPEDLLESPTLGAFKINLNRIYFNF